MFYAFVKDPISEEELKKTKPYQMLRLIEGKGGYQKLSLEEKQLVNTLFDELVYYDTYRTGLVKIGGWIIDFTKYLKTYLVKNKFYGWMEIKAFNKTSIRQNAITPSHILNIQELKE